MAIPPVAPGSKPPVDIKAAPKMKMEHGKEKTAIIAQLRIGTSGETRSVRFEFDPSPTDEKAMVLYVKAMKNLLKNVSTDHAKEMLKSMKAGHIPTMHTIGEKRDDKSVPLGKVLIWPPNPAGKCYQKWDPQKNKFVTTKDPQPEAYDYIWDWKGKERLLLPPPGAERDKILLYNFKYGTSSGGRIGYVLAPMGDRMPFGLQISRASGIWETHEGLHKGGAITRGEAQMTSSADTREKRAEELLKLMQEPATAELTKVDDPISATVTAKDQQEMTATNAAELATQLLGLERRLTVTPLGSS